MMSLMDRTYSVQKGYYNEARFQHCQQIFLIFFFFHKNSNLTGTIVAQELGDRVKEWVDAVGAHRRFCHFCEAKMAKPRAPTASTHSLTLSPNSGRLGFRCVKSPALGYALKVWVRAQPSKLYTSQTSSNGCTSTYYD